MTEFFCRFFNILTTKNACSTGGYIFTIFKPSFFFIIFFNCVKLNAQDEKFRFSNLDINNGLSHNYVNAILKDETGFVWIGTMSGLNRYDGYKFRIFRHDPTDSLSINDDFIDKIWEAPGNKLFITTRNGYNIYDPVSEKFDHNIRKYLRSIGVTADTVNDIIKDKSGNYWLLTGSAGIFKCNTATHHTVCYKHISGDTSSVCSNDITSIAENSKSEYWLVHRGGNIEKMSGVNNKIIFRTHELQKIYPHENISYHLFADRENDIWIFGIINTAKGIFCLDQTTGKLRHLSENSGENGYLNSNIVNGVTQDRNGLIWVATDHGGVNLINKKNFSVRYLLNKYGDNESIAQNTINNIYRDFSGNIWLGTYKKGISCYRAEPNLFPVYKHQLFDSSSLCFNDVNRFEEDKNGNLWIGTNGGGLIYFDRQKQVFKQFKHNPSDANSLCNDVVVSLCMDDEKKLWIGTYYGGLDCYDGKIFKHYRHNENDTNSISDNKIWSLLQDSRKRLWVGTFENGLDLFDRQTGKFSHFRAANNSVHSSYINDIKEDRAGNIWLATSYGADKIEATTGNFIYFIHNNNNASNSLSNNNVICIKEDSYGNIWLGTRVGLNLYNPINKNFQTFRTEDGLPDNLILNILEDNNHDFWISTPAGLSHMTVHADNKNGKIIAGFINYDESDGLQGRAFNEKAAFETREGEMIFGGADGFNIFNPININKKGKTPTVELTELQVFNKPLQVGAKINGHIILAQSINKTNAITLHYNENIFSVEFAALNYAGSSKIKYEYKLDGFSNEWLYADNKTRKATFTNLDHGDYVLKIRACDSDGIWGKEKLFFIKILPPFWKTNVAYIFYILFVAALLFIARRLIVRQANIHFDLRQEKKEVQRLHEMDLMKINFFTNLSHEFRTPLSLIVTPLDKLINNAENIEQKNQYQLIYKNARRLLNLVNQLLDFRKMEVQELKLYPQAGNIIKFIKDISSSFTDVAEKHHISFVCTSSVKNYFTKFDHDKIERILFNILSNAFKFTPENGKVSVEINVIENEGAKSIEINIADSGIGIEAEKLHKIFDPFFQSNSPRNVINQGSGIGLFITKEFVKLHNGSINVESNFGKGSRFDIILPLIELNEYVAKLEDADKMTEIKSTHEDKNETDQPPLLIKNNKEKNVKKPTLLIVEDSEDLRFYLKENLKDQFLIIEASDGKTGWQKALSVHPDLIVSDINMPEMSGIDLCRKLKNDKRTSFIPVILLTAFAGREAELKGLETGASDYLTKPFSFEILLYKIKNLLAQQEKSRIAYQKQIKIEPAEIVVASADEKFLREVIECVEKNLSNTSFSVEMLSRHMCMSRVALYKKLLTLTNKTPLEFIRETRLTRAGQLIEKSNLTISEIAYEVGFNNPKYFSKFFKFQYNVSPSAYQAFKKIEKATSDNITISDRL